MDLRSRKVGSSKVSFTGERLAGRLHAGRPRRSALTPPRRTNGGSIAISRCNHELVLAEGLEEGGCASGRVFALTSADGRSRATSGRVPQQRSRANHAGLAGFERADAVKVIYMTNCGADHGQKPPMWSRSPSCASLCTQPLCFGELWRRMHKRVHCVLFSRFHAK